MVLRRMMGPSLETGAVLDAVLSVNYCAIAIACLRLPSHLFVMKKGSASGGNGSGAAFVLIFTQRLDWHG
jgi:hypothetical protein